MAHLQKIGLMAFARLKHEFKHRKWNAPRIIEMETNTACGNIISTPTIYCMIYQPTGPQDIPRALSMPRWLSLSE
jgi:hypothetical protein